MKQITNTSSINLRITVKDSTSLELTPKSFIYSNEPNLSPTIRVYEKKNLLKIENVEKPIHLEVLRVYTPLDTTTVPNIAELMESQASKLLKGEYDTHNIIVDAMVDEKEVITEPIKNKGGRPKGSTNKPQKSRPKSKKKVSGKNK